MSPQWRFLFERLGIRIRPRVREPDPGGLNFEPGPAGQQDASSGLPQHALDTLQAAFLQEEFDSVQDKLQPVEYPHESKNLTQQEWDLQAGGNGEVERPLHGVPFLDAMNSGTAQAEAAVPVGQYDLEVYAGARLELLPQQQLVLATEAAAEVVLSPELAVAASALSSLEAGKEGKAPLDCAADAVEEGMSEALQLAVQPLATADGSPALEQGLYSTPLHKGVSQEVPDIAPGELQQQQQQQQQHEYQGDSRDLTHEPGALVAMEENTEVQELSEAHGELPGAPILDPSLYAHEATVDEATPAAPPPAIKPAPSSPVEAPHDDAAAAAAVAEQASAETPRLGTSSSGAVPSAADRRLSESPEAPSPLPAAHTIWLAVCSAVLLGLGLHTWDMRRQLALHEARGEERAVLLQRLAASSAVGQEQQAQLDAANTSVADLRVQLDGLGGQYRDEVERLVEEYSGGIHQLEADMLDHMREIRKEAEEERVRAERRHAAEAASLREECTRWRAAAKRLRSVAVAAVAGAAQQGAIMRSSVSQVLDMARKQVCAHQDCQAQLLAALRAKVAEVRQARRDEARLGGELRDVQASLEHYEGLMANMHDENMDLTRMLAEGAKRLATKEEQLEQVLDTLTSTEDELMATRMGMAGLQEQLEANKALVADAQQRAETLQEANDMLHQQVREMVAVATLLSQFETQAAELHRREEQAASRLQEAQDQAVAVEARHAADLEAKDQAIAEEHRRIEALQKQLDDVQAALAERSAALEVVQEEVRRKEREMAALLPQRSPLELKTFMPNNNNNNSGSAALAASNGNGGGQSQSSSAKGFSFRKQ